MTSFLVFGETGVGKTAQTHAIVKYFKALGKRVAYGIAEAKDVKTLKYYGTEVNKYKTRKKLDVEGTLLVSLFPAGTTIFGDRMTNKPNPTQTIMDMVDWANDVIEEQYDLIILDGISLIRNMYAKEAWLLDFNTKNLAKMTGAQYKSYNELPEPKDFPKGFSIRKKIGKDDASAWESVNNMTNNVVSPLIAQGIRTDTTVILTSGMTDDYVNHTKMGRIINCKDWIEYEVEVRLRLLKTKDGIKYKFIFEKVPDWSKGVISGDLDRVNDDDVVLLTTLISRGLI